MASYTLKTTVSKSVRKLAEEANISPSVIQDLRTGKQHDIKLSNLLKIVHALGYELILEKGDDRLILQENSTIKDSKPHLCAIPAHV